MYSHVVSLNGHSESLPHCFCKYTLEDFFSLFDTLESEFYDLTSEQLVEKTASGKAMKQVILSVPK